MIAAPAQRGAGATPAEPPTLPLVLLCECAGTMANIDFRTLAAGIEHSGGEVRRGRYWCGREGQAEFLELLESPERRPLVFAGCAYDFAARRFQKLFARGLAPQVADIREGCSWVHGGDVVAVTDKARRIVMAALAHPDPRADTLSHAERENTVLVIGGGVAGTQAAAELAQMNHRVELVERRAFLGGRAARIGTVFPTNDCGQCLPTTDAQAGTRKCFHRNAAIDHPSLRVWRRTTVESVGGRPGAFDVTLRQLPNIVTDACIGCGACEAVCPTESSQPGVKSIFGELYDGRVVRTVDLDTCTFCGACVAACPVDAIDFSQSPRRVTVHVGAILAATGCRPAPREHFAYLGHDGETVITQVELAERLDDWTAQAALGRQPVDELVMVQCAGSRDRRHLPHCSRLCCMIALKHAIRLRSLFPRMRIVICYLEMRTAGLGYENWYLAARRAGVEFLRGTPSEVQVDAKGRPVIEVEDVTAAHRRVLRPDLVVLSTGMAPAADAAEVAQTLGIERDVDGFIDILDRKNRATETNAEGVFVCGSAAGPKALIEVNTEASAVASEIHNFLASSGRRSSAASVVNAARCIGCDACVALCPFRAITLVERPAGAARPPDVRDEGRLAVIDDQACRACGICAASCPEMAIAHNVSDDAIAGRLALLAEGVDDAVVGFYCKECAGAAISLSGQQQDSYPESIRLIELPCLGRVSALHIIEAARLGVAGVFLAGCAENRCHYRSGDASAREQVEIATELLAAAGVSLPIEQWHLCAADRDSVGRRFRQFHARATGGDCTNADIEVELSRLSTDGSTGSVTRAPAFGRQGGARAGAE